MNLGLLGFDPSTATVAAAAIRGGDRIAVACDVPAGVVPPVASPRSVPWEDLLDPVTCDAILVAASDWNDARADIVRKLVQAGRTLVLSQPLDLSMLFAYELDMIRHDSGATLLPILPDRLHPFMARLRNWIEIRLPSAGIETINLEHRLVDRSKGDVLRAFCRDSDLIRVLAGAPTRLSTLGAPEGDAAWSTLAVGLTCPSRPPVRWQVVRADEPGLTITVVATDGAVRVEIPAEDALAGARKSANDGWRWIGPEGTESSPFDRGGAILGVLRDALNGRGDDRDPTAASWDDAARGVELAETVPRSLAKGRGIDLHQEEFTEIGTFKGTMASLGCGIVLLALAVIVGATLLGGIARQTGWEFGERLAGLWPMVVLVAMGIFLLLQFLPALIAPASSPSSPAERGAADKPRTPSQPRKPGKL
jgi:myo-inositol 2-dehydrogenase/D-chiro-inositol 1-dehydrogenase